METEMQKFERICRSVGVNITTISFMTSPDKVFDIYRATIKECEKDRPNTDIIGWKGKGSLEIKKIDDEFLVTEHRKSKSTGEIYSSLHFVRKTSTNLMLTILRYLTEKGERPTYYRDIVRELKQRMNLNVGVDAFNGGTNRAKYYFPYYYYNLKILEYYKAINYSGRGVVTLLDKGKGFGFKYDER